MTRAQRALLLLLVGAAAGCRRGGASTVGAPRPPRPPLAQLPSDLSLPLRTAVLPNGLRVLVAEMPASAGATVALVCTRGGDAGVAARPGLAAVTRRLLAQAIVDRAGSPPGSPPLSLSLDRAGPGRAVLFQANLTTGDVTPMMWGLASALRRFAVRPEDLARVPGVIMGAPAWTPAEVEGHFHASYAPSSCTLVVAGAVSFDPVMAYAEPLLGPWTNPTPPGAPPAAPPPASARFVLRGQPGREQTRVTVSFPVRVEGARERAVFRVACGLLSPWQSSRLMRVLRHERGDVYFLEGDCRFADGAFEIRVEREFARDGAAASLRVIRDAASALARGDAPVTAGEVDLVRRQVFSRWRTVVDSQEAFVQEIFQEAEEGWAIDGSPPPWIDALRTVTPDEVDAFVRRELSTDRARVDVVGDPGAITPESFAGLGFGPPTRE